VAATETGKRRLLALDDNLPLAELIGRVAAQCGFETHTTDDPTVLPRLLDEWKPDVLTLDLSMPREDGVGILSLLEESHFTGSILIVSGQDSWLRKAARRLAAGRGLNVIEDMEKPVDLSTLRKVLLDLHAAR
jgi:DNA-binding response OmpR family regulator